jgi:hypothetical protein
MALGYIIVGFVYFFSAVAVFSDARERGANGWVWAMITLLVFWPLSLLLWLIMRPAKKESILDLTATCIGEGRRFQCVEDYAEYKRSKDENNLM